MKKKVMVSICCITYNQKKYIRQTLDSFLSQQTSFSYEIIIHDDKSTDGTTEILKEYEKKYPNVIKVMYENENQYCKGVQLLNLVFQKAKGKYIAVCEGDDYWCDDLKLQKQFEFMELHSNCSLLTHGCYLLDDQTGCKKVKYQPFKGKSRYYSLREIIIEDGGLFATNSMFFRAEYIKKLPSFYFMVRIEDFPLTIHLALCGDVYFMQDIMSVYRVNAIGSWTLRQTENMSHDQVIQKRKSFDASLFKMMDEINITTNYIYQDYIEEFTLRRKLAFYILCNDFHSIKDKQFKELYKYYNFKNKIKLFLARNFPCIYKMRW